MAIAEVLTLGECMGLVYPTETVELGISNLLRLDIAGAESNLCIGLSRLGIRAKFISRVGDDPFGRLIRQVLEQEGVDTSALLIDPDAPTGVFFRENLPDGERRVYYYRRGSAASRLSPRDLSIDQFTGVKVVHLTGITPALSPTCAAASHAAVELARQAGATFSFDPNFRPRLWGAEAARDAILPFIRQADILLIGHEDAREILNVCSEEEALSCATDLGPQLVVLKLAERGARGMFRGVRMEVPPFPVHRVVDPVGAGDGFDAGFLAGWLRGQEPEDCLMLGARVGAAAVGVIGDYEGYPRLDTSGKSDV